MNYTRCNRETIHTKVTAVKLYEDYILAGIGSNLCVYSAVFCIDFCIDRIKVLNGQNVYGIVPSECGKKILIYGGKQYTVLSAGNCEGVETKKFTKLLEAITCDDWLKSGVWLNDKVVALLTAHNVVQKWNITTQKILERYPCNENSLLYGSLLLPLEESVLVLAGTAYSEVLIHNISDEEPMHQLKGHKDLILSISCQLEKHIIVTTSSDKSIRLWGPKILPDHPINSIHYWKNVNIECKYVLYEHNARVTGSCITDSTIISVGEDSAVCYWSFEGKLYRKSPTRLNGSILCVDANNQHVLTGGDDGAVMYHSLITSDDYCERETVKFDIGKPKKVKFTVKRNLLLLNETNLVFYDVPNKKFTTYKLNHESGYKMLELADYRQTIAIADMNGRLNIYVEKGEKYAFLINIVDTKLHIGKILSMHWTRNYLVFCSDNVVINFFLFSRQKSIKIHSKYILPPCKERWLTAVSKFCNNELFVCGDRSGNVHMYTKGNENPIRSFSRVHGDYGPTIIYIHPRKIVTAGKDGIINYFASNYAGTEFKYMSQRHVHLKCLEFFLDLYKEIVCGFKGKNFVLYDLNNHLQYIEIPCGGGHRPWDAVHYFDKMGQAIQFVYLKQKNIIKETVSIAKLATVNAIEGFHTKEINCLKTYKSDNHKTLFYLSGGEDTTLRISDTCRVYDFRGRFTLKHLSSVITFKVFSLDVDDLLLVSGGGRGQICIRRIDFKKYSDFPEVTVCDLVDYVIKGTDVKRDKRLDFSLDVNPKINVMEVDIIRTDDHFMVFAGCSDAVLRIFTFKYDVQLIETDIPETWLIDHSKAEFKLLIELEYHKTCILKTRCIKVSNRDILVTCTSRGEMIFWDILAIILYDVSEPFLKINMHKSGVNSFTYCSISEDKFLIATGGDDNTIHLNLFQIADQNNLTSVKVTQQWSSSQYHSSQITGLCFVDKYMLSTSVDQRVSLFEWGVSDEGIRCDFLSQHWTDVADVRGLDLMENSSDSITICVFGKGMEILCITVK